MHANLYLTDSHFFYYDILFQFFFFMISLMVSVYALRIYRVTSQKQVKLFGISFLMVSAAYLIQTLFNLLILEEIREGIFREAQDISMFTSLSLAVHIILMTAGLTLLLYMTFRTERLRLYLLILVISLTGIFIGSDPLLMFFILSSLYLFFIVLFYLGNYLGKRQAKTLLVVFAFAFLFLGMIQFIFLGSHQFFYVAGNVLELLAYIMILANFYLVTRK